MLFIYILLSCIFATSIATEVTAAPPQISTPTQVPKLIGGTPTDISVYPHQLSLRVFGFHICGASIIHEKWALSAAVCIDFSPPVGMITLLAGATNKSDEAEGFLTTAVEYIYHPDFDRGTHAFDVVVIRVQDSFTGSRMYPIRLATPYLELPELLTVATSGWGFLEDGTLPDILHELDLDIVDFETCNQQWNGILSEGMICAGRPGFDICSADNGGALIYCGLQVGITLFGTDNCDGSTPSVFTDVSHPRIRSFIREATQV